MHVWLELEEVWLGAPVGAAGAVAVLVEGVEAVGVAEVVGLLLALVLVEGVEAVGVAEVVGLLLALVISHFLNNLRLSSPYLFFR